MLIIASLIFVFVGFLMAVTGSFLWVVVGWAVSPEGVAMKTAKAGVVPWSEILDVRKRELGTWLQQEREARAAV